MQKPQGTHVLLSVTGVSRDDDIPMDGMHMVTTGFLSEKDDAFCLHYDETSPEGGKPSHITLTMDKGVVTMDRTGDTCTSMVFHKGKRFEGVYSTPYGTLDMGVYPTVVQYQVTGSKGEVKLRYQLDLQGQFDSMHELLIRFVPNQGSGGAGVQ